MSRDDEDLVVSTLPSRPRAFRLVGPGAAAAKGKLAAPLGAPFADDGDAVAVALDEAHAPSIAAIARALPSPATLASGTLVIVLPFASAPSLASRLFAAFGRDKAVTRALRSSALLARGYVELGACHDEASRQDLVWGRATGPC